MLGRRSFWMKDMTFNNVPSSVHRVATVWDPHIVNCYARSSQIFWSLIHALTCMLLNGHPRCWPLSLPNPPLLLYGSFSLAMIGSNKVMFSVIIHETIFLCQHHVLGHHLLHCWIHKSHYLRFDHVHYCWFQLEVITDKGAIITPFGITNSTIAEGGWACAIRSKYLYGVWASFLICWWDIRRKLQKLYTMMGPCCKWIGRWRVDTCWYNDGSRL